MLVVKIGGSLYNTPELKKWLDILAKHTKKQPVIIVPGGGPFADQVRTSQSLYHFNDSHAHHMAILAMSQFGILLASLQTQCKFIHYPSPIIPIPTSLSIWLPDQSLLAVDELEHSWDISSDSLSLWFSQQIQAEQLLIIKRTTVSSQLVSELSETQILDTGFASLFKKIPITTKIIHYQNHANLDNDLSDSSKQLQ